MIECTAFPDRGLIRIGGITPNGTTTVTRIAAGVPNTSLRNGLNMPITTGGWTLEDSEAPVGVDVTYRADISVTDRIIQRNLVPTPNFLHGAQGWVAGSGRTLTIESDPTAQHPQIGHFSNNAAGAGLAAAPTLVGHINATAEVSGSYTLTPPTTGGDAIATDDWVYIVHQHTADIVIGTAMPSGFTQIAAETGTALKLAVWRRKRQAGDTGYTVNPAGGAIGIGTCFWVRGASDTAPIVSPVFRSSVGQASAVIMPGTTAINPSLVVTAAAVSLISPGAIIDSALVSGPTFGWAVGLDPARRSTLIATETMPHAGNSLPMTAVYSAGLADVLAYQIVIPNATALTNRIIAKAKVTALAGPVGDPYRLTGRFRFTSTNVWLWDDVEANGTWDDLLADKATWADVLSTVVPGAGEYSRLFAAIVNPADGTYYVQPIQVLGFEDTRANTWLNFIVYFSPKVSIPDTAEIWFIQGTYSREFSMEWYLDAFGITDGEEMETHTTLPYLDGDMAEPAGSESAMDPLGSWSTPNDDSSIEWTGTVGNSISVWLSPSVLRGTTSCRIDWPMDEALPCEPILLSDPVSSALGMWVGLLGIDSLDHEATSSDSNVLNREDPVASSQVRQWERGSMTVLTPSLVKRTQLLGILKSGRVLLIRNPDPDYPENNWYLSCKTVRESRVSPDHRVGLRTWEVPFTRVARPSGLIDSSSETTWDVVAATWTWDQLKVARRTWLEVVTTSVE